MSGLPLNRVFLQSSESMHQIPDCLVSVCATSPPYFSQIDYQTVGQIGLERAPADYIARLATVFAEVHRILRNDGVGFIVIKDTYHGDSVPRTSSAETRSKTWDASLTASNGGPRRRAARIGNLRPKTLIGIPGMLEEALKDIGFIIRDRIVWLKPKPRWNPRVTDRCTNTYEFVFQISKSKRYYFDAELAQQLTNVWNIPVDRSGKHPAPFPVELALRCVGLGSRQGDIVLDPFLGSGTTVVAAELLDRRWVGYELNAAYLPVIDHRLAQQSLRGIAS